MYSRIYYIPIAFIGYALYRSKKLSSNSLFIYPINFATCHKNRFIFLDADSRVELSECSLFARVIGISGVE